jgi:hypothetical protein
MTDVRSLIQLTLDNLLAADGIYSHWGEKSEVPGEAGMYVIYNVSGDSNPDYADNEPISREAYSIISFYYLKSIAGTATGRTMVVSYETSIKAALRSAGFSVSSFDDNDPDDALYSRIVIEATFGEGI